MGKHIAVMGSSYNGPRPLTFKNGTCEILKCIIFVLHSENVNYQSNIRWFIQYLRKLPDY